MTNRRVTVVLTEKQIIEMLVATDDYRMSAVENGIDTRLLDRATSVLGSALVRDR